MTSPTVPSARSPLTQSTLPAGGNQWSTIQGYTARYTNPGNYIPIGNQPPMPAQAAQMPPQANQAYQGPARQMLNPRNAAQRQMAQAHQLTPYQQQQLLRQRQRDIQNRNAMQVRRRSALFQTIGRLGAVGAARRTGERVGSMPTPGGIPLMLFLVAFFLLVLLPVNGGYTRLGMVWLALLGRVSLPPGDTGPNGMAGDPAFAQRFAAAADQVASPIGNALSSQAQFGLNTLPGGLLITENAPIALGALQQLGGNIAAGLAASGIRLPGNLGGNFG